MQANLPPDATESRATAPRTLPASAARAVLRGAQRAAEAPDNALLGLVAVRLLGAKGGEDVAAALGCSRRTGFRVLEAYRRALGALADDAEGALDPPDDRPESGATDGTPARGGRGGSALLGSVHHPEDPEIKSGRRASGAALTKEASAKRYAPKDVSRAVAFALREHLRLGQADIEKLCAWVDSRWSAYIASAADPQAYAVKVAINRAHELGIGARSGREAVAMLHRGRECPRCETFVQDGCKCACLPR